MSAAIKRASPRRWCRGKRPRGRESESQQTGSPFFMLMSPLSRFPSDPAASTASRPEETFSLGSGDLGSCHCTEPGADRYLVTKLAHNSVLSMEEK